MGWRDGPRSVTARFGAGCDVLACDLRPRSGARLLQGRLVRSRRFGLVLAARPHVPRRLCSNRLLRADCYMAARIVMQPLSSNVEAVQKPSRLRNEQPVVLSMF